MISIMVVSFIMFPICLNRNFGNLAKLTQFAVFILVLQCLITFFEPLVGNVSNFGNIHLIIENTTKALLLFRPSGCLKTLPAAIFAYSC
jgi:hypothetical protein